MALNKLMHPRNPYRKRPDFKSLAIKYPEFRKYAQQDLQGKVCLDFKSPESLRTLTWVLLKNDWNLDVTLPLDRLIPTIPLRLNYILWLEDVLGEEKDVAGIDIGAGASCVYALLGARKNQWKFVTSEADPENYQYALKNVERNNLSDKISVFKVEPESSINDVLELAGEQKFSFCMSNPPFFANNLEAWGTLTSRNEDRDEPKGVCTAAPTESIAPGGEVEFVKKIIADSLVAKSRVRVYSAMLGRKISLFPIREELAKHKITNYGITEFCQGRTMRWGIGWSFDPDVKFPPRPSKMVAASKPKPPILHRIPLSIADTPGMKYNILSVGQKIIGFLDELKTIYEIEKSSADILEVMVVAPENTWSHSRKKRRRNMRDKLAQTEEKQRKLDSEPESVAVPGEKSHDEKNSSNVKETSHDPKPTDDKSGPAERQNSNTEGEDANASNGADSEGLSQKEMDRLNMSVDEVEEYLVKCDLVLKKDNENIILSLQYQDGLGFENLHQVMQFFKNRLK